MNLYSLAVLNGWEIVLIFAVILVLFGAKKLPELAKGLGHGIKEFKKATREVTDELQTAMDTDSPPPAPRKLPEKSASEPTYPHATTEPMPQDSTDTKTPPSQSKA